MLTGFLLQKYKKPRNIDPSNKFPAPSDKDEDINTDDEDEDKDKEGAN